MSIAGWHAPSALALLLTAACGSASTTYRSLPEYPGELMWRYDGELMLTKDGRSATDLEALRDEVRCVPLAVKDAERANDLARSGSTLDAIGQGLLLVASTAGLALVIAGAFNDDMGLVYGGLGAIGGGLFIGGSLAGMGTSDLVESLALRLDAVNRYNDVVASGGCVARGSNSSR
jgi:hypothetical protein